MASVTIKRAQLSDAIEEHFSELHTALWGQGYYLIGEGGSEAASRQKANEWLASQMTSVLRKLEIEVEPEPDPNQLELDV